MASVVDEYPNLDLIGNARYDSVLHDLAPQPTGRRGRPAKYGCRLSIKKDFTLSEEKIGGYYTGVRRVLTNIFGTREVLAYVTATEKDGGSRRLFFSTIFPEQLQIFCAWQEKAPLNETGSSCIHSDGTLRSAITSRKPSGRCAAIWYAAEKGLKCWLI